MIQAKNLSRTFKAPVREKGIKPALKSLIKPKYKVVEAVKGINCYFPDYLEIGNKEIYRSFFLN